MNYNDKLREVTEFIEENIYDPTDLIIALGLSVEDIINLLPDVLVANHSKFLNHEDEEDTDNEFGESWEDSEEDTA